MVNDLDIPLVSSLNLQINDMENQKISLIEEQLNKILELEKDFGTECGEWEIAYLQKDNSICGITNAESNLFAKIREQEQPYAEYIKAVSPKNVKVLVDTIKDLRKKLKELENTESLLKVIKYIRDDKTVI